MSLGHNWNGGYSCVYGHTRTEKLGFGGKENSSKNVLGNWVSFKKKNLFCLVARQH